MSRRTRRLNIPILLTTGVLGGGGLSPTQQFENAVTAPSSGTLQLWHRNNITSGTTIPDATGNGYTAAITGTVTTDYVLNQASLATYSDTSFKLTGTNPGAIVQVTTPTAIGASATKTLAFLVRQDGLGGSSQGRLFQFGQDRSYARPYFANNVLEFMVRYSTTNASARGTVISMATAAWVFFTIGSDKIPHIYAAAPGGTLAEATYSIQTTGVGTYVAETESFFVGSRSINNTTYDGLIDEVMIYSGVLTTDDMQAIITTSEAA